MNILVTGANGQLGNEMRIVAGYSADRYVFTDISQPEGIETVPLDITDPEAVREIVARESIDIIVNCAAYTNVEAAEDNYDLAELLNAKAPANLAAAMKEVNGLLVHISTDYVFGKEPYNTPCKEDREGTPTGVYGLTKLHGENAVRESGCRHVIIRTAWLYSEFGKNFVRTMLDLTASRPVLKVVFDQAGTPTYALDLAEAIAVIISKYADGAADADRTDSPFRSTYHFSNEGVCSWYDFTKMIAFFAGHDSCDVRPCHSDEFPSKVIRPAYSVLDKSRIKEVFGISVPYWTDSLRTCIGNLSENQN